MKAPRHKFILGEGDDAAWFHLAQHLHSFIYAARDKEGQVVSLHQLVWAGARTPSVTPLGIIGWVTCLQNSENGDALPLGSEMWMRVHVCRQCPCQTLKWSPSKYGPKLPPPERHGTVLRCCDADEVVLLYREWDTFHAPAKSESTLSLYHAPGVAPLQPSAAEMFAAGSASSAVAEKEGSGAGPGLSAEPPACSTSSSQSPPAVLVVSQASAVAEQQKGLASVVESHAASNPVSRPSHDIASTICLSKTCSSTTSASTVVESGATGTAALEQAIKQRAGEISVSGRWIGI